MVLIDLLMAIDPRARIMTVKVLDARSEQVLALPDEGEPTDSLKIPLVFNWSMPPLVKGPDLLVLATELPEELVEVEDDPQGPRQAGSRTNAAYSNGSASRPSRRS